MKILITGGLGFVGTRLVDFFSKNPANHIVISTRRTKEDLKGFRFPENVSFVNIYTLSIEGLEKKLSEVDTIIHLAALNEIDSVKYLQQAIKVNIGETVKLLEAAKKAKVRKFIYFSTAHVYGSPLVGDVYEGLVCRPTHPYSITHKGAEDFVLAARDRHEIDAIVVRLSNSFGAPAYNTSDRWTLLVNDLCKQAIEEKRLKLRSAGLQYRDFVTLEDVCQGTNILVKREKEETFDGVFNLGSGVGMKVIEMTELIQTIYKKMFHQQIKIETPKTNNIQIPSILNYNIKKLEKLDFQPINDFSNEIEQMLSFCTGIFKEEI